jgi:serine/threonine-protein kinase
MFRLLVGRPPFVSAGSGDLIIMHVRDEPPVPSSIVPALSPAVDQLVLRCLAKDPAQRFDTGTELANAIAQLMTDPAINTLTRSNAPQHHGTIPTTLSAAAVANQTQPPRPNRVAVIASVAGVAIAGGFAGILVANHQHSAPTNTEEPAASPVAAVPTPAPATAPASTPTQTPTPVATPTPHATATTPDSGVKVTQERIADLAERFQAWAAKHASSPCPTAREVAGHEVDDGWGHPIVVTCTDQPADQIVGVIALGPDGVRGTQDDIVSWKLDLAATQGKRWVPRASTTQRPHTGTKPGSHPAPIVDVDGDGIPDER